MDSAQQISQAQEFFRARQEEAKEKSLFRGAIRSAIAGAAAAAIFARRGS